MQQGTPQHRHAHRATHTLHRRRRDAGALAVAHTCCTRALRCWRGVRHARYTAHTAVATPAAPRHQPRRVVY